MQDRSALDVCRSTLISSVASLVLSGIVFGSASASTPQEALPVSLVIVGANVVDLDGGPPLRNATVRIQGDRIVDIRAGELTAAGAAADTTDTYVVEARGVWLVPGLMNMHVHLGLVLPGVMGAASGGGLQPPMAQTRTPAAVPHARSTSFVGSLKKQRL